jgi:hypothetical protein
MIIVQKIFEDIEDLFDRRRLPSVDELRPASCPLCGHLAHEPGKPLGIVGHGTYSRQILGVDSAARECVTRVRRYLCRACQRTIAVLSDHLHPGRWYAAEVILEALRLHLLEGLSEAEIRARFGIEVDSANWRSLWQWRADLFVSLWRWLAARVAARKPARGRDEGRHRLLRFLGEATVMAISGIARHFLTATVHFRGFSWRLGHDPPERLKRNVLPQ